MGNRGVAVAEREQVVNVSRRVFPAVRPFGQRSAGRCVRADRHGCRGSGERPAQVGKAVSVSAGTPRSRRSRRVAALGPMKRYDFALLPAGSEPGPAGDNDGKRPDAAKPGRARVPRHRAAPPSR
ncbi:hypothetical protein GCM10010129_52310 [Streptomyces fumigatiscleroticus]|nr:hypothetical protein GCM10010129_52310 [Streptomyces fumigatiscleroticus]